MLEQIPFFQGLNEAELKRLEDISILKKYKKGEFLFMEVRSQSGSTSS